MIAFSIAVVSIVLLIGLYFINKTKRLNQAKQGYVKRRLFFTPAEKVFYSALKHVIGDEHVIFSQVSLARLITVHKELGSRQKKKLLSRIKPLHVSFVLCHQSDLSTLVAIELDVLAHQNKKKLAYEVFLNQTFKNAGVPLVHFQAKETYSLDDIKEILAKYLEQAPKTYKPLITENDDTSGFEKIQFGDDDEMVQADEPSDSESQEVLCPKCGSPMVLKEATKGRRAGKKFLTCSAYPVCNRAIALEDEPS
ncbi:MAG: DUF2726 domain-containing protein [Ghiorsea sp.]